MPTHKKKMTEVYRQYRSALMDSILLYGTFGCLMFGPVAFGAVEPWSIFHSRSCFRRSDSSLARQPIAGRRSHHPVESSVPADGGVRHPDRGAVRSWNQRLPARLDLRRDVVLRLRHALLSGDADADSQFSGSQDRSDARLVRIALAAFALVQGVAPNGRLYWLRQPRMGGWIYGPYVNHNHYAGLMELLVPIPLVLSLSRLTYEKERIAAGVAAAVMIGTIFLSGSRGGMVAIFVELVIFAVILLRQKKGVRIAIAASAIRASFW